MDLAADQPPALAWFVEAGRSAREAGVAGLGLRWAWDPLRTLPRVRGATELALNRWSAPTPQGRQHPLQLTLVPVLRWTPAAGSPWFVEAGIGLSWHDRHYTAGETQQSTRWNFQDVLAAGRGLGAGQEVSLRYSHVSNAGLRKPNPGEDRLTLRWLAAF